LDDTAVEETVHVALASERLAEGELLATALIPHRSAWG
jgi:hypothetical protein